MITTITKTEKYIEQKVVDYAKARGCLAIKLNLMGNRGYPDRLFVLPNGGCVWVEFKKPKGKPRPLQVHVHNELIRCNQIVVLVDNVKDGKELIDECLDTEDIPGESS